MRVAFLLLAVLLLQSVAIDSVQANHKDRTLALREIAKMCRLNPGRLSWDKKGFARLNGSDITYGQAMCVFGELKKRHIRYPQASVGKIN